MGGWSAATLFCVPILIILLIAGVGLGLYLLLGSDYGPDKSLGLAFLVGTPVVLLLIAIFGFWPFSKEYHYWTPVTGTIEEVSKRIVTTSESVNEKFVVRFQDNRQPYGIEDTRAALIKQGDKVTLVCKRDHQWGPGVDGYNCRWGEE